MPTTESSRVAFITGGASGTGFAIARAFVRAGGRVAIASRDRARGRDAVARLEAKAGDAVFVPCDVTDDEAVAKAVNEAVARFGRLDAAFNCAGVGGDFAPLEKTDQDVWDSVMATNARGTWLAMRHEIPALLASGGGAVVNLSSIYGRAGRPAHHAYVASKHAVIGMTRSVALELAGRGVRVNAICAGLTATDGVRAVEAAAPQLVAALVAEHPMGRMATEDEVAAAALWLCSREAGFVTGTSLAVDGGFLAR